MRDTNESNRPNPILLAVLAGAVLIELIFFVILPRFSGDGAGLPGGLRQLLARNGLAELALQADR